MKVCATLVAAASTLLFAPDVAHAATLFALVSTGELYVSTNSGVTWAVRAWLPVSGGAALVAATNNSNVYLATRSGGFYRSTDAGVNWSAVGSVTASDVVALCRRTNGDVFLLTTRGSVFKSTNDGQLFTAVGSLTGSDFTGLTITSNGNLYALARTGRVAESTDGGVQWTTKAALTTSDAAQICIGGGNLYVLTETGAVSRSTNQGVTWLTVGTLSHSHMSGLAWDGAQLVVAAREGAVARSPDGATWIWQGTINQLSVTALSSDQSAGSGPFAPGSVIASIGAPRPNPRVGDAPGEFRFRLVAGASVCVEIFDPLGRKVAERAPEHFTSGEHALTWAPRLERAGVYLVRLRTPEGATDWSRWVELH